ncbi:hypothetical protein M0R45_022992 [Rubus argutus]|uniref:Uncharacterized protein n=1 Tax=Rubus argutus TaxID=59490 RepID=A0AAW1WQ22_RUBAR
MSNFSSGVDEHFSDSLVRCRRHRPMRSTRCSESMWRQWLRIGFGVAGDQNPSASWGISGILGKGECGDLKAHRIYRWGTVKQ